MNALYKKTNSFGEKASFVCSLYFVKGKRYVFERSLYSPSVSSAGIPLDQNAIQPLPPRMSNFSLSLEAVQRVQEREEIFKGQRQLLHQLFIEGCMQKKGLGVVMHFG